MLLLLHCMILTAGVVVLQWLGRHDDLVLIDR